MLKSERRFLWKTGGGMAAIMLVALAFGFANSVVSSYLEARAYNRVTGKNVTTWDAMYLDLRVQAEPKE